MKQHVSRAYGAKCVCDRIKCAFLIEEQKIVVKVLKATHTESERTMITVSTSKSKMPLRSCPDARQSSVSPYVSGSPRVSPGTGVQSKQELVSPSQFIEQHIQTYFRTKPQQLSGCKAQGSGSCKPQWLRGRGISEP
ncbi:hypothetical protein QTO34_000651 [Cnephaeus nilssonii]|uniref:Large ribosomal subunit protein eL34 n=1 Tax=Cnephaeus nilssonii TaxID=3371016 RepID=A0AA40ICN0_CNENI|nr:hypothetical protein QTO34_000651 [Eptesicus nilssonii]